MAFLGQLLRIHLGRRRDPELDRDVAPAFEQLAGGAEVADVGHARADEDLVDLGAGDLAEQLGVVRVVRAAQHRLLELVQVDLDHRGVLGIAVGFEQLRLGQPGFDRLDAALQRAAVLVAIGDHVFHQHDVAGEVFLDRLGVELDGAAGCRALGAGV